MLAQRMDCHLRRSAVHPVRLVLSVWHSNRDLVRNAHSDELHRKGIRPIWYLRAMHFVTILNTVVTELRLHW